MILIDGQKIEMVVATQARYLTKMAFAFMDLPYFDPHQTCLMLSVELRYDALQDGSDNLDFIEGKFTLIFEPETLGIVHTVGRLVWTDDGWEGSVYVTIKDQSRRSFRHLNNQFAEFEIS
jgi:hypothetical protein